jgi:hypothetical protein
MKIIPPKVIEDADLTTSNVPENDYPEYDPNTTYVTGDRVILASEHAIYECVIAEGETLVGVSPLDLVEPSPWLKLEATNRWRMFDGSLKNPTSYGGEVVWDASLTSNGIYTELSITDVINSIAFFGLGANKVHMRVTDDTATVIYDKSVSLTNDSEITDWYAYFFNPVDRKQELVLFDLPTYLNGTLEIFIESISGDAEVKEVVLGRQEYIGRVMYGVSLQIEDFSRKERDAFGNPEIVKRDYARLVDVPLLIDMKNVDRVNRLMQKYRSTPVVYAVLNDCQSSLIYGFYRDFSIVMPDYNLARCSLEIEGLNETD